MLFFFALLLQCSVLSAQKITLELPDSLAGKQWVLNEIAKSKGTTTTPVLADCKKVPTIFQFRKIYANSIEYQFDADQVYGIYQEIVNLTTGSVIYSGTVEPKSNVLTINFATQAAGKYKLRITATTCKSDYDEEIFEIKSTGSTDIPLEDPVIDPNLKFTGRSVTQGIPGNMNLSFTSEQDGEQLTTIVTDKSEIVPASTNEFLYLINGVELRQKEPLRNYVIQGSNEIRIVKFMPKVGLTTLGKWSDTAADDNGWYDHNSAQTFPYNVSGAFSTVAFIPSSAQQSGFLSHIPPNYDPSKQQTQWADISEDLTLSKGRVFILNRGEWDMDLVRKKGVTHISHFQIPRVNGSEDLAMKMKVAGQTYADVFTTNITFGLNPTGKPEQWVNGYNLYWWPEGGLTDEIALRAANFEYPDAVYIGENLENSPYMPATHPGWKTYYKNRKAKYEATFPDKTWYICHNYFEFWPNKINLGSDGFTREQYKVQGSYEGDDQKIDLFTNNGNLSDNTLIVEGIYINNPDGQQGRLFSTIYRMNIFHKIGMEAGIFLAPVHEWKPNNAYRYDYPEGTYYKYDKIPLDPNLHFAMAFISQVYGKVYVEWGGSGKSSETHFSETWGKGTWFGAGQTSSSPYPFTGNRPNYTGGSDLSRFSLTLWNRTFGKTEGGQYAYLKFRIDGGSWVTPSNQHSDDVVDAFYDKRGIAYSQTLNNRTAWFYVNPYADNFYHTIEVVLPNGKTISQKVAGNGIHAKIETL